MNKSIRNLIIFTIVAVGGGWLGVVLDRLSPPQDPMQGLGALVWLVSPLLANLLLRLFGGDGWKDFGLGLNLRGAWIWYLAAPVIILVASFLPLVLGSVFGAISFPGFAQRGFGAFLSLTAAAFGMAMIKNIFEEFSWRGYLTPRFEALKLNPYLSSILTGFIWAAWHVPYYLYFLNRAVLQAHTPLPVPVFLLSAFLVLPFHAFAYGELRLLTKSTWTTWLLHNFANAISLTLISEGFVRLSRDVSGVLLSPGTEGILHSLIMGLIGFGLYKFRISRETRANLRTRNQMNTSMQVLDAPR
jgi:membrane protease YdiL (CAAX protease family)